MFVNNLIIYITFLFSVRVAKFEAKVGSRSQPKFRIWTSLSLFWAPSFTILHVCGTSFHTVVFIGKRNIT